MIGCRGGRPNLKEYRNLEVILELLVPQFTTNFGSTVLCTYYYYYYYYYQFFSEPRRQTGGEYYSSCDSCVSGSALCMEEIERLIVSCW